MAAILGESNMSSFDWSNKKNLTPYRGLAGIDAGPRPRILYFAPKEFWPPDTGAKVRNYYLARGMAAYADVTYLAFSDRRDTPATESVWFRGAGCYGQRPGSSDQEMSAGEIERIVTVRRDPGYRLSNILLGAIGRTPLTVLNYTTADMSACLAAVLEEGDIYLTEKGRTFVQADVDGRRLLFAEALRDHVPLAKMIRQVLDERWNHRASAVRFRDELEDHMSPDYAESTLRTVIGWGRYAEMFSYDEETEQFSLDDLE